MAHARCWAFIAPLLAENYHLVAFDLSGMGDSGWRENYTVLDRVDEAKAVAEHLGMTRLNKKPFLVCHSYGGSVGLSAAEEESDAWGGLIVCDMTMLAPDEISDFESYRKKGNQTRVTLEYHADPEIPIPSWVSNRYVVQGPAKSLSNLKKRLN